MCNLFLLYRKHLPLLIFVSKITYSYETFKISRPKVTKSLQICLKKYCESCPCTQIDVHS